MSMASHLTHYLAQRGTRYELCPHPYSHSSAETARHARIMPHMLAKPVVLEDDMGCLMAVIPADRTVMLDELGRMLGRRQLRLADERRIAEMFKDCDMGAIPPVGMAWGMETLVDDDLEGCPVVYMEGGDHEHLLKVSHDQFQALMATQRHGHFSRLPMH